MMKKCLMILAALAAFDVGAITATKEYVDRKDAAIVSNVYTKTETDARIIELAPRTDLAPATNYTDEVAGRTQQSAGEYTDGRINDLKVELMQELGTIPRMSTNDVKNIVTNEVAVWSGWKLVLPDELTQDQLEFWRELNQDQTLSGRIWLECDSVGNWTINIGDVNATDPLLLVEGGTRLVWTAGWSSLADWYDLSEGSTVATRTRIIHNALGLARLSDLPTNHVTRAELEAAIEDIDIPTMPDTSNFATKSELAAVSNDSAIVTRLFMSSNVIDEVTNYNSVVRLPSRRMYQLTESNDYVMVWNELDQHTNTLAKAEKHADDATNELARTLAPRAWSKTTSGLGADAPANTTWISTPTTVIAGGLEYSKVIHSYGQAWVLSGNGMIEFNQNTNAYLRIVAEDGTEIFSIEKTDAVTVGADADGITVSGNVVTIPVNVVSSDHPTMYWRQTLDSGSWSAETDSGLPFAAVWSGTSGAWVMTVTFSNAAPASSFFRFTYEQPGSTVIKNSAATDVSGGLVINGVHYSTIGTATISGHTVITVAP